MQFDELPEFQKDLKDLKKRYFSLDSDLETLKRLLNQYPQGYPPAIVQISYKELAKIRTKIYKVKHFRCRALKGRGSRSGIRITYALDPDSNKITFTEIYYKEREDTDCDLQRILKNFS